MSNRDTEPDTLRSPWLLRRCDRLSRRGRWGLLATGVLPALLWCFWCNRVMAGAWTVPDVLFYMDLAAGRYDRVPQPFTSRPLAPLLASAMAHGLHLSLETAFTALAVASLVWTMGVVSWLLLRSPAPRWSLLVVVVVPFWPQLVGYAGLPDPLYTALLAGLLVAMEREQVLLGALLMLPLMLARESTALVLVCFLLVGWRRLRWAGCLLAVACAAGGALVVRHLSAGGMPNPEHLSGGLYMVGKIISNSLRSLGVVPWSDVYPYLCPAPAWTIALHLGGVRRVGVCSWDGIAPLQAVWAFLTTFGLLPVLLLARPWRRRFASGPWTLVTRFCLLYGGLSLLLAPTLGTWYARLFAYAWPLWLVALPQLAGGGVAAVNDGGEVPGQGRMARVGGALLLSLHAAVCVGGMEVTTPRGLALVVLLEAAAAALFLVQLRRWPTAFTQA